MIENIKIVRFANLKNANVWEDNDYTFEQVSYGDATMTLVTAEDIASMIENNIDGNEHELQPLLDEVRAVPSDVLIALDG